MNTMFLKDLREIAMESAGFEDVAVEAYAGSACDEELLVLDHIDNMEIAMESYTEAIFAEAFEAQEIALESAGLTFGEISKFNGELGMEAVGNAIKRGAYGAQIQIKKVIQKVVKIIMSIFDWLMTTSGKFKSYSKLFKKYKEKLQKVNPSMESGDKDEKEYTIRTWDADGLVKLHNLFIGASDQIKALRELLNKFKSGTLDESTINTMADIVSSLFSGIGANPTYINSFKEAAKSYVNATGDDVEAAGKTLSAQEDKFDNDIKDIISTIKDNLKEGKEDLNERDTTDMTFYDAKNYLMPLAGKLQEVTNKDLKYKSELAKIRKIGSQLANKKMEGPAIAIGRILQKFTPILGLIRTSMNYGYKGLTSIYQAILADMAKIISAGTKIND